MQVVDTKNSEIGPQRRKASNGRLLHCCCICGRLEPWGAGWSCYCSEKELDDCVPVPKFCSDKCRERGGLNAGNVTDEMKRLAREAEFREPTVRYREATASEKYSAAVANQRARHTRVSADPSEAEGD